MITYMVGVGGTSHQEGFFEAIKKLESINEEKLMTLAEYLKPEVFKRGLKKGLEKDRKERDVEIAKAKQEKGIEITKTMILKRIDIETVSGIAKLSQEEVKKLLS